MSEINFKDAIKLLLRRWWVLFICTIVFGGASYIWSNYYLEPIYSANTTLYVGKNVDQVGIQSSDLYLGSNLILDYREIAKSKLVASEVIKELGLTNMSAGSMAGRISVTQKNETRVIQISVNDTNPDRAMKLTNKVAEVFQKKVVEIMQVENVQIIDKAEMPMFPISPDKNRNYMLGIVFGMVIAAGIIFLIEFLNDNIRTPEDIQKHVDLPVIGTIPVIPAKDGNDIITHTNPMSIISEAYRVLRTNIQYFSVDKRMKTIVVTSSGPMEGKTTTVANLAVAFAQTGCRVLLIDSDLRKPRIHKLFALSNRIGLTNYLAAHDDIDSYIKICDIQNLDILTCGAIPPNPSELLASNSMKKLVEELSMKYDIVFMDAPPVGNVTDASIISTFVDGTILVANSGHVEIDALKRAKETLDKVNAHIIGVSLNRLDKHAKGNNYYYQKYYSDDTRKDKKNKKMKSGPERGDMI